MRKCCGREDETCKSTVFCETLNISSIISHVAEGKEFLTFEKMV